MERDRTTAEVSDGIESRIQAAQVEAVFDSRGFPNQSPGYSCIAKKA